MRETKKIRAEIEKWISNNGACDVDIKNEDIYLFNGGLFQDMDESKADLWVGDLDDAIRYLTRLKNLLNKLGFDTRRSYSDFELIKRRKKK